MGLDVRRVVTGHDAEGKAIVVIDEVAKNIVRKRPGYESAVIWATETFPADLSDDTDGAAREVSGRAIRAWRRAACASYGIA